MCQIFPPFFPQQEISIKCGSSDVVWQKEEGKEEEVMSNCLNYEGINGLWYESPETWKMFSENNTRKVGRIFLHLSGKISANKTESLLLKRRFFSRVFNSGWVFFSRELKKGQDQNGP